MVTYTYYHNGLRKSKTVNGQAINFHWDTSGNLVRESDVNGNIIASYYYDSKGNLVGLKKNNQTYLYHTNLRGDIVSITDYIWDNVYAKYNYDPWGKQISTDFGTLSQPFRYAGYYFDEETGLYYLKNRCYSPQLGRFMTKDAYKYINNKNPQTLNLYAYCNNNPVSNIDLNGKFVFVLAIPFAAVVTIDSVLAVIAAIATITAAKSVRDSLIQTSNDSSTPTKTTSNRSIPLSGDPDSVVQRVDEDGNVTQERFFDSNGRAFKDIDYTDHGNPKMHPEVPHEHYWDWRNPDHPVRN